MRPCLFINERFHGEDEEIHGLVGTQQCGGLCPGTLINDGAFLGKRSGGEPTNDGAFRTGSRPLSLLCESRSSEDL